MIADLAVKAIGTRAVEPVLGLVDEVRPARAVVETRVALAARQRHRAVLAAVELLAAAHVVGPAIVAGAVLAGRVALALVDVDLAVLALEALVALAGVAADVVLALALDARRALALVYVGLAVLARHAQHADALVPGDVSELTIEFWSEVFLLVLEFCM